MAGVSLSVPSFRVCVVADILSVTLTLIVLLPTRTAGTMPVFVLVVYVRPTAVSYNAFSPTTDHLAVVAERSEVGV